jgi:hypothetical protein
VEPREGGAPRAASETPELEDKRWRQWACRTGPAPASVPSRDHGLRFDARGERIDRLGVGAGSSSGNFVPKFVPDPAILTRPNRSFPRSTLRIDSKQSAAAQNATKTGVEPIAEGDAPPPALQKLALLRHYRNGP